MHKRLSTRVSDIQPADVSPCFKKYVHGRKTDTFAAERNTTGFGSSIKTVKI